MPLHLVTPNTLAPAVETSVRPIEIALLNNLGDGGLKGGERQFVEVLSAAAGPDPVRLRFFSLPCIARGAQASSHIEAHYTAFADLMQSRVDGLIVTGAEPVARRLPQEPFWRQLTEVIDWAEHNTRSTIFSCLAAHAAVLHLDGVDRRPLTCKCSGVFSMECVGDHPLIDGLHGPLVVPHSRWNGLDAGELASAGYDILTRSHEVGVDMFVKQWRSLFVFLQGHPEYDENALRAEYRRDVLRFTTGLATTYPALPRNYFSMALETQLRAFEVAARRDPATTVPFPLNGRRLRQRAWRRSLAVNLFRNWLRHLGSTRGEHAP